MIPYGRQDIDDEDIAAVVAVLKSDFLTQGPCVPAFESAICARVGAQFASVSNSATSSLHLACLALGLGAGDVVWTVPNTFVASANCALYCGARVDFVDIDPNTYNMSVDALAEKLAVAETAGTLPKIVIPVHFGGEPCDMAGIYALSTKYGFSIIEDASHAVGASYQQTTVGDCAYSDITIFSFHPVKIVTSGEGGAATTNEAELHRKMALLRSQGVSRAPEDLTRTPDGPWYYEQIALGFNYRMTDIHAALGARQLEKLDQYIARRHQLAGTYDRSFSELNIGTQLRQDDRHSALHLYVIELPSALDRRAAFEQLRAAGVGVNVHYIPVHLQPYYRQLGFSEGQFPSAEKYYRGALTLPLHPSLSDDDQAHVIGTVQEIVANG